MDDEAFGTMECAGQWVTAQGRGHGATGIPLLGMLAVLACAACGEWTEPNESDEAIVESSAALSRRCPPAVPDALAVPAGNRVAFALNARGVQIYRCEASGTTPAWVFQAPEAELTRPCGAPAGTHYAGPTWESRDGSKVVGTRLAGATVTAGAIPWLLLQATAHENAGRMAAVTFIQRVATTGGVAPADGCDGDHLGDVARVDYTATYYFYEAQHGKPRGPGC